jgi:hypothetical protein
MMEMASDKPTPNWRKFVTSGLVGALVGGASMIGLIGLYESGALGELGASGMIACVAGTVYVLIGVQVGLGVALPALGWRFLNVEDAEEIREQRGMLAYATAVMIAWGGALIAVALAGPGGILAPGMGLAAALGLIAVSVLLTALMWRHMDELMRGMSRECGNISFYLLLLVGGTWATLAHLGFAAAPAPLDWLTMFTALTLLASFVAVGMRGMLRPR